MAILPQPVRSLTPARVRDDVRLRAFAVALGLIPPRTMHSHDDARVLLDTARGAQRVVEIGVYEGASALMLQRALGRGAQLHLIDPFGRHPDALPGGWGASERATRRLVSRAGRRLGEACPDVHWHAALSHDVAASWSGEVDLVFIDGDHSEAGCEIDWLDWSALVSRGGHVVFHDAREDQPGGRGLPGPTAVVARHLRGAGAGEWTIVDEADRTVAARRNGGAGAPAAGKLDPAEPGQTA
ncbi:MAG TPA: class I SAM-dependent methyltransferase [Solirubrobacteraceae bacterium]|jgi:predicted O-methyltransferase YrrM|nr:class I SAM-dependent methyltransferase [Solirubrobacteraceae bacterium]